MQLVRRSVFGLGLAAATAPLAQAAQAMPEATPVFSILSPGAGGRDYAPALMALRAYAAAELKAIGMPGMTLSVADDQGFAASLTLGYADLDLREPVKPTHLFQIGSISKAFASLCLFTFAEEGKLDLDAPLSRYLPEAALPPEPITVAQVMSHSAGLADGAPIFPHSPDGKLWCGFAPGSKFSYSNTGYELLGQLIARLGGAPHPEVIRARVLKPLGLGAMLAAIKDADRGRFANSYSPFRSTWPNLTGAALAAGPWTQMDEAAGSLSATAETMSLYVRFLMRLGRGDGAPLFGPALAKRFATAAIDCDVFGPRSRYGYGLGTVLIDDKPAYHHTGGMITFTSSFHVDAQAGVGCFASVNASLGDYRPRHTTAYALQLLRAVKAGAPLPPAPDPLISQRIDHPEVYAGRYVGPAGEVLLVRPHGAALDLAAGDATGRLEPAGRNTLMTSHPSYAAHLLTFDRTGEAPATALWWGEILFRRDGAGPAATPAPARLASLAGHYLNNDPWTGDATVFARGDGLVMEGRGALTQRDGGYWALKDDPGGVERFWFEGLLNGRPQRLNASGAGMMRLS